MRLNCLASPLACGWYAVVVKFLTPECPHTSAKKLLTNFDPISINRYVGIPNGTIQKSEKMFAICLDDVLEIGTAQVNSEYRSVITQMY